MKRSNVDLRDGCQHATVRCACDLDTINLQPSKCGRKQVSTQQERRQVFFAHLEELVSLSVDANVDAV
jgi:hypothetical protein